MSHANCLNCNAPLHGEFCCCCGQSATTHRITTKHFLFHDILHGVWHIEKGMLFTLKEVFTRPGHAAKDYISGKRIRYYNVFYLIMIVLGFIFIATQDVLAEGLSEATRERDSEAAIEYLHMFTRNFKFVLLAFLPLFAINGYILFRRLKYNLAEHLISAGFISLGMFIFLLLSAWVEWFSTDIASAVSSIIDYCCLAYFLWSYRQLTKGAYRIVPFLLRMVLFVLIFVFELLILLAVSFLIVRMI